MAKRILVCGGRDFDSFRTVWWTLDDILAEHDEGLHIITGCASGADEMALEWAASRGLSATKYYADWKLHGRSAGPKRNQRMLDEGKPTLVVAFPGGRGTADMVWRAKAAGVPVIEPTPPSPPRSKG